MNTNDTREKIAKKPKWEDGRKWKPTHEKKHRRPDKGEVAYQMNVKQEEQ
jgi:hypothetical protein